MEGTTGLWPLMGGRSNEFVNEIMKTIGLERADAVAMAVRMLVAQLIMAADMPAPVFGETQGAA